MKKKILIPLIIALIILTIFIKKDKTVTIITLDINPSIEISLDKNNNVIKIKALNDDAKNIIDDNYKGKTLDKTFTIMIEKLKDNGFELKGSKCINELKEGPQRERICEDGYELKGDRCINKNDTTNYVDGYICDNKEARVEGKECIIYEIVEAKQN